MNTCCESLSKAIKNECYKDIRKFIKINGKDILNTVDTSINGGGDSFLHDAIDNDNFKMVKFLVGAGINVNIQNNAGATPLTFACWQAAKYVRFLLDNGADPNIGHNSQRPIFMATETTMSILKCLLTKKVNVNIQDEYGNTPLHYRVSDALTCANNRAIIKMMIEKGANPTIKNNNQEDVYDLCDPKTRDFMMKIYKDFSS